MSENETTWIDVSAEIKSLVQKANDCGDPIGALQYSQAACNVANAMACANNDKHCQLKTAAGK